MTARRTAYVLAQDVRGSQDGIAYEYPAGTYTPKGAAEKQRFDKFVRFGFATIETEKEKLT